MKIIQRLNGITALPTLPEIALEVQRLSCSDESCVHKLARLIEQDPALTAKLLQVANSSWYGAVNRISSVSMAITRMGFCEVGNIVMATSVIRNMSSGNGLLDYRQFWRHALTAAHVAHLTANVSGSPANADERHTLYLAGLLHDIGLLIYDQFFPNEFGEIIRYASKHEKSYLEAEREVAPKDSHAAVGAALLERWKLSPAAINGVRYHHTPTAAAEKQKTITYAIYLSEYILCNSGIGSFEGAVAQPTDEIIGQLNIKADELPSYLDAAQSEVERSDVILALERPEPTDNKYLRTI